MNASSGDDDLGFPVMFMVAVCRGNDNGLVFIVIFMAVTFCLDIMVLAIKHLDNQ